MLNLISMAVVGLVVFSIWLYGVRIWHEDFEFGDDFVAIFLAHAFFIGFPFCFFIGLYHTSLFAKKFVTRSFGRSWSIWRFDSEGDCWVKTSPPKSVSVKVEW